MDILKHLQCSEVMCVCVYFLFLSAPSSPINLFILQKKYITYVSGYLHISAEHFNMYSLEIIEIGKHFI